MYSLLFKSLGKAGLQTIREISVCMGNDKMQFSKWKIKKWHQDN